MPKRTSTNLGLASRITQARRAAGFGTVHAAAIHLGLDAQTYGFHEQGRAAAKPTELRRYAELFGVSHAWLSTGIGAGPKPS